MSDASTKKQGPDLGSTDLSLIVVLGPNKVMVCDIPEAGTLVVGRENSCDVAIEDESVSRKHARIVNGRALYIEDLSSTNGTRVSGLPLAQGERSVIKNGSMLEFGSVVAFLKPRGTTMPAESLRAPKEELSLPPGVVVHDPSMLAVYRLIPRVARAKLSLLILGETGSGKDVFAETVHRMSDRAEGPFVRVNCAALTESLLEAELFGYEKGAFTGAEKAKAGLFEAAHGGTIFLDEVGEMSPALQAMLLRVLESGEVMRVGSVAARKVDVRVVAATHRDLDVLAAAGQFRSDLLYRINGIGFTLPPLRDRPTDIVPLAEAFLRRVSDKTIAADARAKLLSYRWPGNVRELRNVMERAALLAEGHAVEARDLHFGRAASIAAPSLGDSAQGARPSQAPFQAGSPPSPGHPSGGRAGQFESDRARVVEVMERFGHNQSRAAKELGMSRGALIRRLEEFGYVRPRKGPTST